MSATRSFLSREGFAPHSTITRTVYPDAKPFRAPPPERRGRLSRDGFSSGSSLVREVWDDKVSPDPHYGDLGAQAAEVTRAAADSILRPAHLANRGTNR
jgi:hypothetical protein